MYEVTITETLSAEVIIDENRPDISRISDFLFATFLFYGYGHHHISGSLNFIKKILDFFGHAILIY